MTSVSPRVDPRLLDAAQALDDPTESIAETWRKVCLVAESLGLTRPGYDTIRMFVRDHRHRREEIRRLLTPVVVDALRGRVTAWDVEQVTGAVTVARTARESRS